MSGPITVSSTSTIKTIAYLSGWTNSAITSASYNISSGCTGSAATGKDYVRFGTRIVAIDQFASTATLAAGRVSTPNTPTGNTNGQTATGYSYNTGGSADSCGNPVQYRFFWGDGTNSDWLPAGTTQASHAWASGGTFNVTVQARSAANSFVHSGISSALSVAIQAIVSNPNTFGPGLPIDGPQLAGSLNGQQGDYFRNYGPILYGGFLWAFPLTTDDDTGDVDLNMKIYKSADGVTWTQQDHDHAPQIWLPNAPAWDGTSSRITILPIAPQNTDPYTLTDISLIDFDMSTGQFGSAYGAGSWFVAPPGAISGAPFADIRHANVFKLSNGTVRVVYHYFYEDTFVAHNGSSFGGTQSQVYYRDFAGGAWSSPHLFPNNTVDWQLWYQLDSAVQDGDTIHVVYSEIPDAQSAGNHSWYVQIAADGSFSTPVPLDSVLSADGAMYWRLNTGALSGNSLLIPVPSRTGMLVSTPKSNPTFNYVPIGTSVGDADMKISHQGGKDVIAWVDYNPSTNHESLIYMATSTNGGTTWTTPTLVLNLDATPPPAVSGQDTLNINTVSLGQNLDGSLGMLYTSWAGYYAPPQ